VNRATKGVVWLDIKTTKDEEENTILANSHQDAALLGALQAELVALRLRNDKLLTETEDLKSRLRREAAESDVRAGSLAMQRITTEELHREVEVARAEHNRSMVAVKQHRAEKAQMVAALLQMSEELDELHQAKQLADR
jgi:hypothetical protein